MAKTSALCWNEETNRNEVVATAQLLGYSESDLVVNNATDLYQEIDIDLKQVAKLAFWLRQLIWDVFSKK